jgi:hypothetical protein
VLSPAKVSSIPVLSIFQKKSGFQKKSAFQKKFGFQKNPPSRQDA